MHDWLAMLEVFEPLEHQWVCDCPSSVPGLDPFGIISVSCGVLIAFEDVWAIH